MVKKEEKTEYKNAHNEAMSDNIELIDLEYNTVEILNKPEEAHLEAIKDSMTSHGWVGRPVLVYDTINNGYIAFTGSHRITAATELGILLPCYIVSEEAIIKGLNEFDMEWDDMRDDDHRLQVFSESGDLTAHQLMQAEVDSNYR